jgi:hypothetical protein
VISEESADANGRLIAAAPDLLTALTPFADLLEDEWPDDETFELTITAGDVRLARAAIAKATS